MITSVIRWVWAHHSLTRSGSGSGSGSGSDCLHLISLQHILIQFINKTISSNIIKYNEYCHVPFVRMPSSLLPPPTDVSCISAPSHALTLEYSTKHTWSISASSCRHGQAPDALCAHLTRHITSQVGIIDLQKGKSWKCYIWDRVNLEGVSVMSWISIAANINLLKICNLREIQFQHFLGMGRHSPRPPLAMHSNHLTHGSSHSFPPLLTGTPSWTSTITLTTQGEVTSPS